MEADNMEDTAVIFAIEDTNVEMVEMVDSSLTNTLTNSEMVEMFGNISVKSGGSVVEVKTSPKGDELGKSELFKQTSPVTRSQLRRQSLSFQFTRPADVDQGGKEGNLRRQSSAFEFRSSEPLQYGSLNRDIASRASLRRRNSSVKDLIQRLEGSTMGSTHRSANMAENSLPSTGSSTLDDNVFSKAGTTEAVYENVKMKPYESVTLKPKKTGERTERKTSEDEKAKAPVFTAPER